MKRADIPNEAKPGGVESKDLYFFLARAPSTPLCFAQDDSIKNRFHALLGHEYELKINLRIILKFIDKPNKLCYTNTL